MVRAKATEADELQTRLSGYRETTLARLLSAVPDREPRGYLYDPLSAHLSRTGKSIRPALCIATCQAFGGDAAAATNSATAIEMLHNAFLVHDDVEDESELRRGQPTMHVEHGIPLAVNAGDMLNALSLRMLRENLSTLGATLTWRVFDEFDHMMQRVARRPGDGARLGSRQPMRPDRTGLPADGAEEDLLVQLHPTVSHRRADCDSRHASNLDRFNRFGYYLGAAFQIQDDLLNLTGDQNRYGKEIAGDLLEGKRTLMLIHLFKHADSRDARRLKQFLGQARRLRSPEDVRWILELMRSSGSIDYGRTVSRQFAGATLYEFSQAFGDLPASAEKDFLKQVIHYMIGRDV